jgi:polyketide synthase 5
VIPTATAWDIALISVTGAAQRAGPQLLALGGTWSCFWSRRMGAAGCGRIVLSSCSQPTVEALETIDLIRAIAGGVPVRGVLHLAAVLEDATLTNITDELIERD